MIRVLSLPMIVTAAINLVIGAFFLLLYLQLRRRHREAVRHYWLFGLLALVSSVFLGAFSLLLNSGHDLARLDVANRITIVFSMFTILMAVHFHSRFFDYRPPLGLRWCYGVNLAFVLLCLVPNRLFLAKELYRTSSYYTGLAFGPLFSLWGAWVLALSAYSLLILFLVYRRALQRPGTRRGPVLALLVVTVIWLLGGVGDDLTAIQIVDLPPLSWVGSVLIIGCIAWILVRQVDTVYEERQRLQDELIRDHLTQAFSRGFFEVRLLEAIQALRRGAVPALHLSLFDLDDFKQINDRHGHAAGDAVLKHVADTVKGAIRLGDCLARQGGDEFALLLDGRVTDEDAEKVLERIRQRVAETPLHVGEQDLLVTCSFGLTHGQPTQAGLPQLAERLLMAADQALYASKKRGKNAVSVAAVAESAQRNA